MGAQYRPEVAEIFPRTRAGKRIDSAMRTIASPLEAIRDESPASMGAMGYGGVGVAFRPRLIQSEEEFTVYLWQARGNRFPAIISPTLRNDRAKPPPPSPPPLYPHVFRLTPLRSFRRLGLSSSTTAYFLLNIYLYLLEIPFLCKTLSGFGRESTNSSN